MRYFEHLHPICILIYFVAVIGLSLACLHPVMLVISCGGALTFLVLLKGRRNAAGQLRFALILFLAIAIGNPLVSHRGVTYLGMVFNQWITLEAVCYGITAGLSLASLILWFACYSAVMTSDKFLYLFGQIAPATSLLITMTFQLIPKLKGQLTQIQQAQGMISPQGSRLKTLFANALHHTSALIGWSVENAVEQADSMKARGYGLKRRTTFHLFHFDSRDARFLGVLLALDGSCMVARVLGHGTMEFYPRMSDAVTGAGGIALYGLFALLVCMPAALEGKEILRWRSYGLIR